MSLKNQDQRATVQIGRFRLDPVAEFEGPRMAPTSMFPVVDPATLYRLLEKVPPESYDPVKKQLITSVHSWLVRDGQGMVLLIDTCFGNLKDRLPSHPPFHMQTNDWLAKLEALGVRPEDVTHVVNTHLHLDHVGWNTRLVDGEWVPTFPHARHIMPRVEVELNRRGGTLRLNKAWLDSVLPVIVAGLADVIEPEFQIVPGIRLSACTGHSPGMLLAEIEDGGAKIIAGGDPLHHPVQILDPTINTGFCEDPIQSVVSRKALLSRCADEGWLLAATHLCAPRVISVGRTDVGFCVRPN